MGDLLKIASFTRKKINKYQLLENLEFYRTLNYLNLKLVSFQFNSMQIPVVITYLFIRDF